MANATFYKNAYEKIANAQYCSNQIDNVKSRFVSEINSKRCLDGITTIPQLLRVLEKRDCLGPDNVDPLLDIAAVLKDASILKRLYNRVENDPPIITHSVLPPPCYDAKRRIYRLIADEIGSKWQDFARALDIREGHIDDLSTTYPRISDRVYEILKYHEENCDRKFWRTNLQEALSVARRNDLKKEVQLIFDTQ